MKKFLVTLMAVLCVMTCGVAADGSPKTEDTTNVTYSVTGGYEWSVPVSIDFAADKLTGVAPTGEGDALKVCITKNVIESNKKLEITIDSYEDFLIYDHVGGTAVASDTHGHHLNYSITDAAVGGNVIARGDLVVDAAAGENTASQAIFGNLTIDTGVNVAEMAGSYSGLLNFTAAVVDAN